MVRTYPPAGRIALGLIAATLAAAAPTILLGSLVLIAFPIALITAVGHAFLIALPVYILLRAQLRLTYASSAFAGFLVGALPIALFTLVEAGWVVARGRDVPLAHWFSETFGVSLVFGVLGSIGGLVFRQVVGESPRVEPIDPSIFE
jgi:hypothetical protein